jgi:hypothetical protein
MEYYDRANWVGQSARLPLSAVVANERHQARKPYGVRVVMHNLEVDVEFYFGPCFCEVAFSEHGATSLRYAFEEIEDQLFLFQATYFAATTPDSPWSEVDYYFTSDGSVRITRRADDDTMERAQTRSDVASNWEPRPTFGNLCGLVRRERSA